VSETPERDVRAAESAVNTFLELYRGAMGDRSGPWVRECADASEIFARIAGAQIAKDKVRAEHHKEIADKLLDSLIAEAGDAPLKRGAVGRLAELLAENEIPIPPKLGKALYQLLASGQSHKAADPRNGAKDIEKAIICEAVFIASKWLPIYSNSSPAGTPTAAAIVASAIYRIWGLDYSQDKIINHWKESKDGFQHRRG